MPLTQKAYKLQPHLQGQAMAQKVLPSPSTGLIRWPLKTRRIQRHLPMNLNVSNACTRPTMSRIDDETQSELLELVNGS